MLLRSKSFSGSVVESAKRIPPKPQFWQKSGTLAEIPDFAKIPEFCQKSRR
jgi:hypothetical protein